MNKRRIVFSAFSLVSFFISFATLTRAQVTPLPTTTSTSTPGEKPKTWVCMESKPYNYYLNGEKIAPGGMKRHIIEGNTTGLPSNKCVYVVGCIHTAGNIECTTGNAGLDQELHLVHSSTNGIEIPNATYMHSDTASPKPYEFIVDGGSKKCNLPNGDLTAHAFSEALTETTHSMFAVYFTDVDNAKNDESGNASTLKYGQFGFGSGPGACDGQRWDPYGVAFDAKSLEPLPSAQITLLTDTKSKVVLPGLLNPVFTKADGMFNFLPEPGRFMLQLAKGGYSLAQSADVHQNYTKAYSQLYQPNEVILEEAGKEEHRDVALLSVGTPYHADPSHINYGVTQLGLSLKVAGKQSHPLTVVSLMQDGQEIAKSSADKYGYYQFNQSNQSLRADTLIDVYFTKFDLTQDVVVGQSKKAYSTSPVPPYIEGKAYDKTGKVLGSATVKVRLDMSGKVYTQTKADENGVFSIPPSALPPFPYSIEYTPASTGSVVKKSVVDFARENKDYFAKNNVNIMTATRNGQALVVAKVSPTQAPQEEMQKTTPNNIRTIVFLMFILVLLGILGLFYYLRHQKSVEMKSSDEPTPLS